MKLDHVLATLKSAGREEHRSVYRRHGVRGPLFGVDYETQRRLAARLRIDHDLARALWSSGNHDARVLATMVADPDALDASLLDRWEADLDNAVLTDALVTLVNRSPAAMTRMRRWVGSPGEWSSRAGWLLLGHLATSDPTLPDDFFLRYLETIDGKFAAAAPRARDAMHAALIAIGMRNGRLQARSLAAVDRLDAVSAGPPDLSQ